MNVNMLRSMLGKTRSYCKFIRCYVAITTPMEKLLKKDVSFVWSQECQGIFDKLKAKMASVRILMFPDWNNEFHVHMDALFVVLGVVVGQLGEGDIDHPIAFASRKLSFAKKTYTTTEREGQAMVYALHKFRHYLLGSHFKMFIDHSSLKYLVNKPVLGGKICRCLLLFQEFDFEIIMKSGHLNVVPNHLYR